jgi:cytochrome c553
MERKSLGLVLAGAASCVIAPGLFAGDYHVRGTLDCADCHKMHFESSETSSQLPADVGPLLQRDVNDLCLSCHDNSQRATDVLGFDHGPSAGNVRQAGYLNRLGKSGSPGTGHTLGSLETAPGSSPPWRAEDENGSGIGLTCVNCHAPHGDDEPGAYRNLRSDAGNNARGEGLVTYNHERAGSNDLSRDVFVRRARDYDESAVDFNEPNRRESAMARFCAGCHDKFHGEPGTSANIGGTATGESFTRFVRHPSSGVGIGAIGGDWSRLEVLASRTNRVKVMSETGQWSAPGTDATPTCISCHKAHGNGNPFGLIFRSGRGTLTEDGDTQGRAVEDLCAQCHSFSPFAP